MVQPGRINTSGCLVLMPQGGQKDKDGVVILSEAFSSLQDLTQLAQARFQLWDQDLVFYSLCGRPLYSAKAIKQEFVVCIGDECFARVIPGPKPYPLIGNLDVYLGDFMRNADGVLQEYDGLAQLTVLGRKVVITGDADIAAVFLNENEYFSKRIEYPFSEIQQVAGNGLFTSNIDDENWRLAHKLLMPAFSASAMRQYVKHMGHLSSRLVGIFKQFTPEQEVDIGTWMTNITLEVIGQVGFGYDFHLLDSTCPHTHPFVDAMNYTLTETFGRMIRTQYWKYLPLPSNRAFVQCIELMRGIVDDVIKESRASPSNSRNMKTNLMEFMLNAYEVDSQGSKHYLSDENIRDQVITFLIAGHETTSNTLSWTLYLLNQHPTVLQRVQQEIDAAEFPDSPEDLSSQHVARLPYLTQCIKESMRLYPPIFVLVKTCLNDTVLPGGYKVEKGSVCETLTYSLHRNPKFWGLESHKFNPDNFSPEACAARHPYAWMPFSTGPRGCLGMQFALQEIRVVLAYMLKTFTFRNLNKTPVDWHKGTLTLKPMGMRMAVQPRSPIPDPRSSAAGTIVQGLQAAGDSVMTSLAQVTGYSVQYLACKLSSILTQRGDPELPSALQPGRPPSASQKLPTFSILYGSNMGMSEEYARQLGAQIDYLGCRVIHLAPLDQWMSTDGPEDTAVDDKYHFVLIITSTYNGLAPDNAAVFQGWLRAQLKLDPDVRPQPFQHLQYSVFGCGNSQWATFQSFPNLVARSLYELGGTQFFPSGQTDSNGDDSDQVFLNWSTEIVGHVFMTLGVYPAPLAIHASAENLSQGLAHHPLTIDAIPVTLGSVDSTIPSPTTLSMPDLVNAGYSPVTMTANRELRLDTTCSAQSTRHIELSPHLPMTYRPGDHLEVLPQNSETLVKAVAAALGLDSRQTYTLPKALTLDRYPGLPSTALIRHVPKAGTIGTVLAYYADLCAPPSMHLLDALAQYVDQTADRSNQALSHFYQLRSKVSRAAVVQARDALLQSYRTVAEVLQANPTLAQQLSWGAVLTHLTVIQPRPYSVASTPSAATPGKKSGCPSLHLTVAVVRDTVENRVYSGLASGFLSPIIGGKDAPVWARLRAPVGAGFHLPDDLLRTPIICIGAGTGIAPFRGFFQERQHWLEKHSHTQGASNIRLATAHLYFGCRHPSQDFIYRDDLCTWRQTGVLSHLVVAFSQWPANGDEKQSLGEEAMDQACCLSYPRCYVQDAVRVEGEQTWQLWHQQGAHLYVCGSTKMDRGVRVVLLELAQQFGGLNKDEAAEYLTQKKLEGKYLQDVWSS
ncbi:hypothetical protein H4R34_000114 [Dimargaris verticillata]|uniref:NADPH--hemoprotein reductase n=1 Tax=Dimargaris verticillata TaxID=2761393 RepID=A0A9W8BDA0_9FUNG|nr:hypothetical protein H4R34_000114 [Dimargaris verticillata]